MAVPKALAYLIFIFGLSLTGATTDISIVDGIAAILGLTAFFIIITKHQVSWIYSSFENVLLLIFGLFVILSSLFLPYDDLLFGMITLYLISLYFLSRFIRENNFRDTLLQGYLLGAAIASVSSLFIFFFLKNTSAYEAITHGGRITFLFSDPNIFGAFLVPALLLGIALFIRKTAVSKIIYLGYATTIFLMLLALLLTASRGAYLQGIIACYIFLCLEYKTLLEHKKKIYVLVALVVVPIMYVSVSSDLDRVFLNRLSSSDIPRIENIKFAQELIVGRDTRSSLTGTGSGSYEYFSPDQFSAHNLYVRLITENGIIGFTVFLLFIGTLMYRRFHKERDIYAHVLFASVLGILVHGMFIDTLHWRHFWLLLGLL